MVTIDFETDAIQPYPDYPPKPVGVAIKYEGRDAQYYSWGHPSDNNCTFEEARSAVKQAYRHPVCFHNAKFDIAVADVHMGLSEPAEWHDTQLLLYLYDPNRRRLNLKEGSEELLGIAPEERDELHSWILKNVPEATKKTAGAFICRAPGALVGKYAIGDVNRTEALYHFLLPYVVENGMQEAYNRERRLLPILMAIERYGIRVDTARLEEDATFWRGWLSVIEGQIITEIGYCDLDSNSSLLDALLTSGKVDKDKLLLTPKGALSTSKHSLKAAMLDAGLNQKLLYRNSLSTLINTFMLPWLERAHRCHGRLHAQYHQTRGDDEGGTRTGRLSSSDPNLQNVPNNQEEAMVPVIPPEGFPSLPLMRSYLLPEEGHVWLCGDIKAQEPKLTAHFEDGDLLRMYQQDPLADVYTYLVIRVKNMLGLDIKRKVAKAIFLGLVYGMGAGKLADGLNIPVEEAKRLKNAVMAAMPDVVRLVNDCTRRFKMGATIRTLGGRVVKCEPPTFTEGRVFHWDYKATNTLIQGSAADQTKQAIIYYNEHGPGPILTTVHDEIDVSVPERYVEEAKEVLTAAVNSLPCDVPMTMEFFHGSNWAEASK